MSDDTTPRAYTKEEAKDVFLNNIRALVKYWAGVEQLDTQEKLSGLAFSILNIFDGTTMDLPAVDLVLRPPEDDEAYDRENGRNWWQDGMVINDNSALHEEWCPRI